jgi:hypothetical protein
MASPTLYGPFPLNAAAVDDHVRYASPGVFALGNATGAAFRIAYIGRSENNLGERIKQHVAEPEPEFKFTYAADAKTAFEYECELFHEHRPPGNPNHPARPFNSGWKCPKCKNFG